MKLNANHTKEIDFTELTHDIKQWGKELGFQQVGITDINLSQAEKHLTVWLQKKFHGEMFYMEKHGLKRTRPANLIPGTIRIISVRINYLPPNANILKTLQDSEKAYISRYALGKDYHKVLRQKLNKLAERIKTSIANFNYRAFVDSAPVMEKAIAEKAGLGWIGKHTLVLNKEAGSWFFLGELYTNLPLIIDQPGTSHCGSCSACLDICPTKAIVAPYQLDARRCISYLTIESKKSIPVEFRVPLGNRIFGCDDCQFICPWNKFAKQTKEIAFLPHQQLDDIKLLDLFKWSEQEFLNKTEGSPLRRTGYEGWLRNIAVALGNAKFSPTIVTHLLQKKDQVSDLVAEHIDWALAQQRKKAIRYSSVELPS